MNMLMLLASIGFFFLAVMLVLILAAARAKGRRDAQSAPLSEAPKPDTRESMRPGDE